MNTQRRKIYNRLLRENEEQHCRDKKTRNKKALENNSDEQKKNVGKQIMNINYKKENQQHAYRSSTEKYRI